MIDLLDIYGDYADGYCAPLSVAAGPLFSHASGSFSPAQLPGYPTWELRFEQASDHVGSGLVAFAPVAQETVLQLPWPRMRAVDKAALETFAGVVKGMGQPWTYNNPVTGPPLPVRFAEPDLPHMPEVSHGYYRVDLSLRVALNFPQSNATGTPDPAASGNRFVLGPVVFGFDTLRPDTGYGVERNQTMRRDSQGTLVVYDKARIVKRAHRLKVSLDWQGFIRLQAFAFTWTHGAEKVFSWVDTACGVTRSVRFAPGPISVQQVAYDRFETELNLVEEV